jgi:peptide chain release factor 3
MNLLWGEGIDGWLATYGPEPQADRPQPRNIAPEEKTVAGFVFKSTGQYGPSTATGVCPPCVGAFFVRGMKLTHAVESRWRSPTVLFLAADRELWKKHGPGYHRSPNHGQLRIGDTLTEGEAIRVLAFRRLRPNLLQTCRAWKDPMKAKTWKKALMQFSRKGLLKGVFADPWVRLYEAGALQFEVPASRIELNMACRCGLKRRTTSARCVRRARAG